MNLNKLLLINNDCYKAGAALVPKGIMVHDTGANNPALKRYVGPDDGKLGVNQYGNHWNQARPDGMQKCVHAFIGKLASGSIATYQTLPWNMRGWHAGGKANDTHIGFEICQDDKRGEAYFYIAYKEAVEFSAYLCGLFNFNPLEDGVIISHQEGYRRGVASNHGDVEDWFPIFGKSMDSFRNDVKAILDRRGEAELKRFNTIEEMPAYAKPTIQKLIDKKLLTGSDKGLDLSEDMLRLFVINDRAGGYDREG